MSLNAKAIKSLPALLTLDRPAFIMNLRFEWDPLKAAINWRRHRITFDEALEVFFDPQAVDLYDDEHSDQESRFRLIGMSRQRLLLVIYCEPLYGVIRIISARKAEKKHQITYERTT